MTKVAITYHLNLHHYSLCNSLHKQYLNYYLGELLKLIKVPVNLSITMEDLLLIKNSNLNTFKLLTGNPKIKFLQSTYSHALISHFPKDLHLQLKYGQLFQKRLIPKDKMLPVGMFPEYDFPISQTHSVNNYWHYTLANCTFVSNHQKDRCGFIYRIGNIPYSHFIICLHKLTYYREVYHRFLREQSSAKQVIEAVGKDYRKIFGKSSSKLFVCHIDFEAPIFNQVVFNSQTKQTSLPRLDRFKLIQNAFFHSKLQFVHLNKDFLKVQELNAFPATLVNAEIKGRNTKKDADLRRKMSKQRNLYIKKDPLLYLSCTNSDYFVFNRKKIILEAFYHQKPGRVIIKRCGNWKRNFFEKFETLKKETKEQKPIKK